MPAAVFDQPQALRILESPPQPEISVLVRCYNELRALPEFWRALRRQTIFQSVEVIVLDSGSTDGSVDYLLQQPCSLYQIAPEHFNFGRSCNQLMHLARAPRAVFLSAHVFLEQDAALQEIVTLLTPGSARAAYLRQVPNTILGFNAYEAAYLARRFPVGDSPRQLTDPGAYSNAAAALTKEAWLLHAFPEIHGSEDFEWARLHLRSGHELFYLPHLLAMHSHNESPAQVHRRVRLNVEARGLTGSYRKATFLFGGVFVQTLRAGGSPGEAWDFAWSHASAYL